MDATFAAQEASLTDLDLRILDLLSSQRVLTSRQLVTPTPETSDRTLRYRCNRLVESPGGSRATPEPFLTRDQLRDGLRGKGHPTLLYA